MVQIVRKLDLEKVDFSFVPSLECNLRCSFCMYNCSPENKIELAFGQAEHFLPSIDWSRIYSWGFYGGEVFINLPLYQRFMDLIPGNIPKFIITNGAWSANGKDLRSFLDFMWKNKLFVIVSGTEEHKRHQNPDVLSVFNGVSAFHFKDGDEIHPMGRAAKNGWSCSKKCLTHTQPIRLAMFPGGDIILQNCDGAYPVVGDYSDSFDWIFNRAVEIRKHGCHPGEIPNINDVLDNFEICNGGKRRET